MGAFGSNYGDNFATGTSTTPTTPTVETETSPLGKTPTEPKFKSLETIDLAEHYLIAAAGSYAERQYADISLLKRGRRQ
jgi:hypothetical protein